MTTSRQKTGFVLTVARKPSAPMVENEARSVPVVNLPLGPLERMELGRGELVRLAGGNRWRILVCARGRVWVTQEQDVQDYVLGPGQMFVITQPGKVILQALSQAEVLLTPALQPRPYRGRYEDAIFD